MGLDFTSIPDHEGAALYILHTRSSREIERLERLVGDVAKETTHQAVLIDIKTPDGEKVRDFYDLPIEQLPVALIVRDDDSLAQHWYGDYIPTAKDIAYHLRQTSN